MNSTLPTNLRKQNETLRILNMTHGFSASWSIIKDDGAHCIRLWRTELIAFTFDSLWGCGSSNFYVKISVCDVMNVLRNCCSHGCVVVCLWFDLLKEHGWWGSHWEDVWTRILLRTTVSTQHLLKQIHKQTKGQPRFVNDGNKWDWVRLTSQSQQANVKQCIRRVGSCLSCLHWSRAHSSSLSTVACWLLLLSHLLHSWPVLSCIIWSLRIVRYIQWVYQCDRRNAIDSLVQSTRQQYRRPWYMTYAWD